MTDGFEARWRRLTDAARRAPAAEPHAPRPGWVEQVARRALLARTPGNGRAPEPLAWAGLVGLAAAAALTVLVWPGAVASTADALAAGASALSRSVPRAPRLPRSPAAPRPSLPSRQTALAAVARLPELGLEIPFPPRQTETP
ncbi:MAG: hypothetical protein EHM78_03365 [Myxococcaceae bacterium]|nr:MAG: hypothetical protein EHM78_03365 [Myxococcaceae bacterium]